MKVKLFKTPTFDEWCKRGKKFETHLGPYILRIDTFSWGNTEATYQIGVSANQNPLNVYSTPDFKRSVTVKYDETDKLHEWYERVTAELNEFWENYILLTYFEEG